MRLLISVSAFAGILPSIEGLSASFGSGGFSSAFLERCVHRSTALSWIAGWLLLFVVVWRHNLATGSKVATSLESIMQVRPDTGPC